MCYEYVCKDLVEIMFLDLELNHFEWIVGWHNEFDICKLFAFFQSDFYFACFFKGFNGVTFFGIDDLLYLRNLLTAWHQIIVAYDIIKELVPRENVFFALFSEPCNMSLEHFA